MRILDTDVLIEFLRGNEKVLRRCETTEDDVATTWITAGELYYGAEKSSSPARNRSVVAEILATLPVVPSDLTSSQRFGEIKARLERDGNRVPDADLFIASIALARGAILATGNVSHYARIEGVRIEDWIRD